MMKIDSGREYNLDQIASEQPAPPVSRLVIGIQIKIISDRRKRLYHC